MRLNLDYADQFWSAYYTYNGYQNVIIGVGGRHKLLKGSETCHLRTDILEKSEGQEEIGEKIINR